MEGVTLPSPVSGGCKGLVGVLEAWVGLRDILMVMDGEK
jgi:hypothetical protein